MLAPWVSYCRIDDLAVFLDIKRNRYSALPWSAAEPIIRGDRRAVPAKLDAKLQTLRWLSHDNGGQSREAERLTLQELDPRFASVHASFPLIANALALLAQTRIHLAMSRFERVLASVSARNTAIVQPAGLTIETHAPCLSAFHVAERFVLNGKTCLLRSLALHAALASRNAAASLIFGVKLHPFEAHCWLQHESTLLNDTVERTGLFVPIRIVS